MNAFHEWKVLLIEEGLKSVVYVINAVYLNVYYVTWINVALSVTHTHTHNIVWAHLSHNNLTFTTGAVWNIVLNRV